MIYFIAHAGRIKVGYSANIDKRIKSFRTTMPELVLLGSMDGSLGHERSLHIALADYHCNGEWFEDCPEVRAILRDAQFNGIEEWESERTSGFVPSHFDLVARKLVDVLIEGTSVENFPALEAGLGLPHNFLWRTKYRQSREVCVSEYFSLIRAASRTLATKRDALERQEDFVRALELDHAGADNQLFDTERAYRALVREMEGEG
jgi:hypothetical protein